LHQRREIFTQQLKYHPNSKILGQKVCLIAFLMVKASAKVILVVIQINYLTSVMLVLARPFLAINT